MSLNVMDIPKPSMEFRSGGYDTNHEDDVYPYASISLCILIHVIVFGKGLYLK